MIKIYKVLTLFLVFSFCNYFGCNGLYCQKKTDNYNSSKNESYITHYSVFDFKNYKKNQSPVFYLNEISELKNYELKLEHKTTSSYSNHFLYAILLNDKEILNCKAKVNVNKKTGEINSLFFDIPTNHIIASNSNNHSYLLPTKLGLVSVKVDTMRNGAENKLIGYDSNNELVYTKDLNTYYSDSIISASIFLPDPLTSANSNYEAPYLDNQDNDSYALNNEIVSTNIPVAFENSVFFLENDYLKIEEFSNPIIAPVTSTTPFFEFTRSQSGFEDINTYYHITVYQEYLQSIGLNVTGDKLFVDTHGSNGQDNSFFTFSNNRPELTFGEGGVDDAEDADVIVHEYAHALSHYMAPGTNTGSERRGLDEAFGDYIAFSYSKSISDFRAEDIFTWDGHNEFWSGRSIVNNLVYPDDKNGNIYHDGSMFSSALALIHNDIGRENLDKILFESAYSWSSNMTLEDAAKLLVEADEDLNNSEYRVEICNVLNLKGLYACPTAVQIDSINKIKNQLFIRNTEDFALGGSLQVTYHGIENISIKLYDITGKLIREEFSLDQEPTVINISAEQLLSGVYILDININNQSFEAKKIFKY